MSGLIGGRSWHEDQAYVARHRLELDSEKHQVVTLPCCGTRVEITDFKSDKYVECSQCHKHHVILAGYKPMIRSEITDESDKHLIW